LSDGSLAIVKESLEYRSGTILKTAVLSEFPEENDLRENYDSILPDIYQYHTHTL
jgi:hypothetical protein